MFIHSSTDTCLGHGQFGALRITAAENSLARVSGRHFSQVQLLWLLEEEPKLCVV